MEAAAQCSIHRGSFQAFRLLDIPTRLGAPTGQTVWISTRTCGVSTGHHALGDVENRDQKTRPRHVEEQCLEQRAKELLQPRPPPPARAHPPSQRDQRKNDTSKCQRFGKPSDFQCLRHWAHRPGCMKFQPYNQTLILRCPSSAQLTTEMLHGVQNDQRPL
jgi:hypothetical protein